MILNKIVEKVDADLINGILTDARFKKMDASIKASPELKSEVKVKGAVPTIKKLINICKIELKKTGTKDTLTKDEFINWVNDSCGDTLTPLALDYAEDLDVEQILNLTMDDTELEKEVYEIAQGFNWIDKDGHEVDDEGKPLANVVTGREILRDMITLSTDESEKQKIFNILSRSYYGGKAVVEDVEETEDKEPIKDEDVFDSTETEEPTEPETEETVTNQDVEKYAHFDLTNNLIQDYWNIISKIKSAIATLDFSYKEDNKEDIMSILNDIINDATVDVGMLNKVRELIDVSSTTLIASGEGKAEDLITK